MCCENMVEIIYDKLVRDKIPEIMKSSGKEVITKNAINNDEFLIYLSKKLIEESTEFGSSYLNEELADILEIILTILDLRGETLSMIDRLRKDKKIERGAFNKRIILLSSLG